MKVLALADTQIGVATLDLADQSDVLKRIADLAIERKVDAVIHGGDVFEGKDPAGGGVVVTPEQMRMFLDSFVRPLAAARIPLLLTLGNGRHDVSSREVHGLDVLREVPGIIVSDRPQVHHMAGLAVCTLPWVSPARLVAETNGDVDRDDLNGTVARMLVGIARDLHAEVSAVTPSVLVAHWAITGSALPTGMTSDELREPVVSWADLDAIGFDAVIAGHVHRGQLLTGPVDRTLGFVCGSPQPQNFGEEGFDHGVWLVDVGLVNEAEFVPIESRQFLTFDFDHEDPIGQIALSEQIGWDVPDGAIVRVRLSCTEEQAQRLDRERLRDGLLAAGAYRVQIEVKVERVARARVEAMTDALSPLEALALYCSEQGVDETLAERMADRLKDWSDA